MEKLTQDLEKTEIIAWIDKTQFVGTDQVFEILDIFKLDNDVVLQLGDGKQKYNMRINIKMTNDLIDHFGKKVTDWIGNNVTIVFTPFTPKDGQKINSGVTTAFAWPDEETL